MPSVDPQSPSWPECPHGLERYDAERRAERALLEASDLVPMDMSSVPAHYGKVTVRLRAPEPLRVVGVSGFNWPGEVIVHQVIVGRTLVLKDDIDASAFNLRMKRRSMDIVPMDLGSLSDRDEIEVQFSPEGCPTVLPFLRMTFWGVAERATPQIVISEDVRDILIDLEKDPPDDSRLRALLDKLANARVR